MSKEYPPLDLQSIPSLVLSDDRHVFFAEISPLIAKKILKELNYSRQRSITIVKVKQLVSAMAAELFEPSTSTINFCVDIDGRPTLMDGQHRLSAMVEADKGYIMPLMITKGDPNYVYPKTDRGRPRSIQDGIRSSQIDKKIGLSFSATNRIATAVKLIEGGYFVTSSPKKTFYINEDTLFEIMEEKYIPAAHRMYEILDHLELTKKLVGRLPCSLILTLYTYFSKNEWGKVDEFIYGCSSNIGLLKGDPRRLVYVMYANSSRDRKSSQNFVNRWEEIGVLLTSWKYWYDEKSHASQFRKSEINKILKDQPNVAGTNINYVTKVF